ncbi:MAG: RNA methyltransferase [Rhodospirillales bacterium]
MSNVRGFFGIGIEGGSKSMNIGTLFRSANAFNASFVFAINPQYRQQVTRKSDTSNATQNVPFYAFDSVAEMLLPAGCQLVGVELTEDAIELPSFRHPRRAAYVLGPERGDLSPAMLERCDHVIKIPMSFCINVAIAGAIVMYDRMISLGRFAERPVKAGGPTEELPQHTQGGPVLRTMKRYLADLPEPDRRTFRD